MNSHAHGSWQVAGWLVGPGLADPVYAHNHHVQLPALGTVLAGKVTAATPSQRSGAASTARQAFDETQVRYCVICRALLSRGSRTEPIVPRSTYDDVNLFLLFVG